MIKGINHVGIVVESIDDCLETLGKAFGAKELSRKTLPERGQTSCMVQVGESIFEVMEPYGEEGVVPKFLKTHGMGLHHVSLLSDDLKGDFEHCLSEGIKVLGDPEDESRVVFTHPKYTKGVVYEITDKQYEDEE